MSEQAMQALNVLLTVLIWSAVIAAPIIILILVMEFFDGYKKKKNKLKLDAERIVVKMNEDVDKKSNTVNRLDKEESRLKASVYDLEQRKKNLLAELGEEDTEEPEEEQEEESVAYEELTIKELQDIARPLKIPRFSRMKKDKLIEVLSGYTQEKLQQSGTDKEE